MKAKEQRKVRTYKATDESYKWAMKLAKNEKMPLSNILEATVNQMAEVAKVTLKPKK